MKYILSIKDYIRERITSFAAIDVGKKENILDKAKEKIDVMKGKNKRNSYVCQKK